MLQNGTQLDPQVADLMRVGMSEQEATVLVNRLNKSAQSDLFKGGPGSGNRGHAGRPGQRGGSAASGAVLDGPKSGAVETSPKLQNRIKERSARLKSMEVHEPDPNNMYGRRNSGRDVIDVPGPDGGMSQVHVYKTPGGVTVKFENNAGISDVNKLRVLDAAEDLHNRFGQPGSVLVLSKSTMRSMTGVFPWDEPPFGASMMGGESPRFPGKATPLLLNADTLRPSGAEDFARTQREGGYMPEAATTAPMEYTMTHEVGHMVDALPTIHERDEYDPYSGPDLDFHRPTASQDALDTIPAGSAYGRGAFTSGMGTMGGKTNNDPEAFAESFAEYVLSKGKTTDKLSQALAASEGWKEKL